MRWGRVFLGLTALGAAGLAAFWVLTAPSTLSASVLVPDYKPNLANGETLFNVGGCVSCHKSEGQDDRTILGGGHKLPSPFGAFHAPNISQHPTAGIGSWSELEFLNAMLRGVGRDGEHLYPSLPYTSYQRMSVTDMRDLYAYLKTLPAVDTPSKEHELGFPFNIRRTLGGWKLLFVDQKPFVPDPAKSEQWNRGAYLVEGPGHCVECHSPRNALGGIDSARRFAGGPNPEGSGWVPNITPHADGIGSWDEAAIAELLKTGFTPDFDSVGSTMTAVVRNTSLLTDEDRLAMAAYLKSLPPLPDGPKPKAP
ncbi:MAG: c-type cytochrome [Labrys sp. (in: a-proteobacteria)]